MKREQIVEGAKTIGGTVASLCVGVVVSKTLDHFMPFDSKPLQKIGYSIGSSILCGMIGAKASTYIEESIDDIDEMLKKIESGDEELSNVKFITLK